MHSNKLLKYGTFIVTEVFEKPDWLISTEIRWGKEMEKSYRSGKITAYSKGGRYVVMNLILGSFTISPEDVLAYGPAAELLYG